MDPVRGPHDPVPPLQKYTWKTILTCLECDPGTREGNMLRNWWRIGIAAAGTLALGAGCASSDGGAQTRTTPGNPPAVATGVAPTDPARVEVIPWAPDRTYRRLGEIVITPAPSSTPPQIDTSLRESAASLGAHAVFVIWDPSHRLQVVQMDPLDSERNLKYPPNAIVAVAIRYE